MEELVPVSAIDRTRVAIERTYTLAHRLLDCTVGILSGWVHSSALGTIEHTKPALKRTKLEIKHTYACPGST